VNETECKTYGDYMPENQIFAEYRCIETCPNIKLNEIIADTLWTSSRYHENGHFLKIWHLVIIIAHRYIFKALISARFLETSSGVRLS